MENTKFYANFEMIEATFSVDISLELEPILYQVTATNDEELKELKLVKVKKNGFRKAQFFFKILGRLRDSTIQIRKSPNSLIFPIQSADEFQRFQDYPIKAKAGSFYGTDINSFGKFFRQIFIFLFAISFFMSLFSDPLYFLYMLKHLQILEYIVFFDIHIPKNMIFFFEIIDIRLLKLIPYHLKEYTTPKDCDISPILSGNEYFCSSYQNLAPFIMVIISILIGMAIKNGLKKFRKRKTKKV